MSKKKWVSKPNRTAEEIAALRERINTLLKKGWTYREIGILIHMSPQLVAYHANYFKGKYSKAFTQRSTRDV